jgi:hypothetical protein
VFSSDLEIEHIIPKNQDSQKIEDWTNFLLACGRCNGRDNKGPKEVNIEDYYLPHLNNTFLAFQYREGGLIVVNPKLTQAQQLKAMGTLDLLGLNKYPGNPQYNRLSPRDKRWQERKTAWDLAQKYFDHYKNAEVDADTIVDLARSRGFFSIWYTLFIEETDVLERLIHNFKGTALSCFPAPNFNPTPREGRDL